MRFRKRPVEIEARHYDGSKRGGAEIVEWVGSCGGNAVQYVGYVEIHTLEGVMRAMPGAWIVQSVKGEFYPVDREIFLATYERVGQ